MASHDTPRTIRKARSVLWLAPLQRSTATTFGAVRRATDRGKRVLDIMARGNRIDFPTADAGKVTLGLGLGQLAPT